MFQRQTGKNENLKGAGSKAADVVEFERQKSSAAGRVGRRLRGKGTKRVDDGEQSIRLGN